MYKREQNLRFKIPRNFYSLIKAKREKPRELNLLETKKVDSPNRKRLVSEYLTIKELDAILWMIIVSLSLIVAYAFLCFPKESLKCPFAVLLFSLGVGIIFSKERKEICKFKLESFISTLIVTAFAFLLEFEELKESYKFLIVIVLLKLIYEIIITILSKKVK